jgi:hypothetical protein
MSSLHLRSSAVRRRLAVVAAVLLLGVAVAATHLSPVMDHMGMGEEVAICLAVIETATALILVVAPRQPARPRLRFRMGLPPARPRPVSAAPARAGPAELQVFRR